MPARVAILDGRALRREGMASILGREPGLTVVGAYGSARAMLESVGALDLDVIVLDEQLPDITGSLACSEIRRRSPATSPVVLSDPEPIDLTKEYLAAGAHRVLARKTSARDLARAVWHAARPEGVERVHVPAIGTMLLPREIASLRLAAQGATNEKIARTLGLSLSTVKSDLRRAIAKLHARDKAHAVVEAIRRGLLT